MMKILFVYSEIQVKFGAYGFQHGIAALSAFMKQHGHTDTRLFYADQRASLANFKHFVEEFNPDIVCFYVTHDQYRFVRTMLDDLSEHHAFTICGGPHASLAPEMIEALPRLNAVCIGEGEHALLELVTARERGDDVSGIANLWVRTPAGIVRNGTRPLIADLDSLPLVDRDLFARDLTAKGVGLTQIGYPNSIRISRGCPFGCTFCSNRDLSQKQAGTYLRFRSLEHVLREIESVVQRYAPREMYFEDDTFTLVSSFIDDFCREYQQRVGLPFEFFCRIGEDSVEVLGKLHAAGGRRVSFGIESGNEELRRDVLHKNFTNQQVHDVFHAAHEMGLHAEAFVMAGLPGETPEMLRDTVKLLRDVQPDLYSVSIYFPFKGTELYRQCIEKGYISPDFELDDNFVSRRDSVLSMPQFSRKQILSAVRTFGWNIYKGKDWRKAFLFLVYESGPIGDWLLRFSAPLRRRLRRFVIQDEC